MGEGGKVCPRPGCDGRVGPPGAILQASGCEVSSSIPGGVWWVGAEKSPDYQIRDVMDRWWRERDEHVPPGPDIQVHTNHTKTKFYSTPTLVPRFGLDRPSCEVVFIVTGVSTPLSPLLQVPFWGVSLSYSHIRGRGRCLERDA